MITVSCTLDSQDVDCKKIKLNLKYLPLLMSLSHFITTLHKSRSSDNLFFF